MGGQESCDEDITSAGRRTRYWFGCHEVTVFFSEIALIANELFNPRVMFDGLRRGFPTKTGGPSGNLILCRPFPEEFKSPA